MSVTDLAHLRLEDVLREAQIPLWVKTSPTDISGSGAVYCVLLQGQSGWQTDPRHTVRHPRLYVNIYADSTRDDLGNVVADDAIAKADAVFAVVDKLLRSQTNLTWPEVVSSFRPDEPDYIPVPEDDNAILISAVYELSVL